MADRIAVIGEAATANQEVTRIPLRERVKGFITRNDVESFYKKYGVRKEDIRKAAQLIEEFTGLKVDEKIKRGDLNISLIGAKGEARVVEAGLIATLNELGVEKGRMVKIGSKEYKYAKILEECKKTETELGALLYFPYDNTIYIRKDKIRDIVVNTDYPTGSKLELTGPFLLEAITHELVHDTVNKNNLSIVRESIRLNAEILKLELNCEEKSKSYLERMNRAAQDRKMVFGVWMEALAEYTTSYVIRQFGYTPMVSYHNPYIEMGKEFLAEVERATGKNPIPIVVKNPPASIKELLNPAEYMKKRGLS